MKAKTYLKQLEILDTKINQKQMQLDELKLKAINTSGISYDEKVQTSLSGDMLCNAVTRYIALEQEINEDIDNFVNVKNLIINQIHTLSDVKYIKLLFMRYVQFKRLEVIAVEMNYSYQYTKELHGVALQEFQNTYPNILENVLQ